MSESLEEKLQRMKEEKDAIKAQSDNKLVDEFTGTTAEKDNFSRIVETLKKRKESEMEKSKNADFVKDTLYIQKDVYEAFQSLCIEHGDKKKYVNEALRDFVLKKYNQLK